MERIVIEIPAQGDAVDARVEVEQFDGWVQLLIDHEFAKASVVFTDQSQITATIQALQNQHDDLVWKKADAIVKERYPDAVSWRAHWQGYDDANGGEWMLFEVKRIENVDAGTDAYGNAMMEQREVVTRPIAQQTQYDDCVMDDTSEVLGEVYESPFEGSWVEGDWRVIA